MAIKKNERKQREFSREELLEQVQEQKSEIRKLRQDIYHAEETLYNHGLIEEKPQYIPEEDKQQEEAWQRIQYRRKFLKTLKSTVGTLVVVAAVAVLVAVLLLPVLRIYGDSMTKTLHDGDIVVSVKSGQFHRGDVIAFYYNNKILVKRVIAQGGEWVDLDENGNVYVNDVLLDEPYAKDKALGECDIDLPYQVPEGRVFVMGDHRSVSVDSRTKMIGCVAEEQVVGTLKFCVWPLSRIGKTE